MFPPAITWGGAVHGAPSGAQNPAVIALFRKWAYQHENQRAFVRQDEILDYLRKLNVFIEHAEKVVAAIKAQRSDSSKDSISAAEELIQHAREKGKFFESRFAQAGHASNTFAKQMSFDEQRMVPQHKDLGDIDAKIRELKRQDAASPELTPSQAWALVAANARGELASVANHELAIERLREFNQRWHTPYGAEDLRQTYRYMVEKARVASQYRLERPVGEQQLKNSDGTPLYKLLMDSGFKNTWETGTSQASANRAQRGAVEEQMGYSAALRRTGGQAHDFVNASNTGKFDPKNQQDKSTAAEMPRYAATIAAAQRSGVAFRYGTSYIVWKDSVKKRATWTPGDSWSMGAEGPQSVKNFVSLEHPEAIFVHAEEDLLRMFMAEATGKDQTWLAEKRANHRAFADGGPYIETQIHGDLTWRDVAEVVIDSALGERAQMLIDFEEFKKRMRYDFKVRFSAA